MTHIYDRVLRHAVTVVAIIALTTTASWAQQPALQRLPRTTPKTQSRDLAHLETPGTQPHASVDRGQAHSFARLPSVDQDYRYSLGTDSIVNPGSQNGVTVNHLMRQAAALFDPQANPAQCDATCGGCGNTECDYCQCERPKSLSKLDRFFENVDINGHVRIRHGNDFERNDLPTRNRGRLRARLGMNYKPNSQLVGGLRMSTGDRKIALEEMDRGGAPLAWQDMGDVFDKVEFNLDRLFIEYTPEWMPGYWFTVGKFRQPLMTHPVLEGPMGDLMWDEAAHYEGIAGRYTLEDTFLGLDELSFLIGEGYVLELADADDASLLIMQLWGKKQLEDRPLEVQGGVNWYAYYNLNPDGNTQISTENNAGNRVTQVGNDQTVIGVDAITGNPIIDNTPLFVFDSKFSIVNPMFHVTYGDTDDSDSRYHPVQFVVEWFWNSRAFNREDNNGYSVTVAYGPAIKTTNKGDWKIWYAWSEVEQESVFTPVAQDDFFQATNFRGGFLGLEIWPWERAHIRLWLLSTKPIIKTTGREKTEWRGRVDLTVNF